MAWAAKARRDLGQGRDRLWRPVARPLRRRRDGGMKPARAGRLLSACRRVARPGVAEARRKKCWPRASGCWSSPTTQPAGAARRLLWRYAPESFLPHGRAGDGDEATQPILLATEPVAAQRRETLAIVDGRWREEALVFERSSTYSTMPRSMCADGLADARGGRRGRAPLLEAGCRADGGARGAQRR